MSGILRGAACAAVMSLSAFSASALTYAFDVTGTLTSQMTPGADPNIAVGDLVHVSAQVDASRVVTWGSSGYQIAFLDRNAGAGSIFDISLNGLSWSSSDDIYDGSPLYTRDSRLFDANGVYASTLEGFGAPAIVFSGDQVVGLIGYLSRAGSSDAPILSLGTGGVYGFEKFRNFEAGGPVTYQSYFSAINPSSNFTIQAGNGLYGNDYETPGFRGVWSGLSCRRPWCLSLRPGRCSSWASAWSAAPFAAGAPT